MSIVPPHIRRWCLEWLPANMSRNFFNILEGFQKVEELLDGPEGQYVEDCLPKCRGYRFAKMSRNTSQYVDKFFDVMSTQNSSANDDHRFVYPILSKIWTPKDYSLWSIENLSFLHDINMPKINVI